MFTPHVLPASAKADLSRLGKELRLELRRHYVYKDNRGRIGNWYMPACWREIRAIDEALTRHVPALTADVMDDVRSFNARFSTSDGIDAENAEPE